MLHTARPAPGRFEAVIEILGGSSRWRRSFPALGFSDGQDRAGQSESTECSIATAPLSPNAGTLGSPGFSWLGA